MFHSLNVKNKKKKALIISMVLFLAAGIYLTLPGEETTTRVIPVFQEEKKAPIYYVDTEEKVISISFDAAWGASTILHKSI